MKTVCAITGGSGYVGGCVKNYFAARGWEILELTRRPKPDSRAIKFQLGEEILPQSLAGVSALVHCAYDFKPLRWLEIHAVNIVGSRKILEAARAAEIPKIIFISSISAFDGCRSLYGRAKLEVEKIALENGAVVIRPGLVYGRDPGGMFGKLVAQIRNVSVIPVIGDGSQIQFLVHNEDLCAFIEKFAADKIEIAPRILTTANEQPLTFKQLLLKIARAVGKKPKFIPLPWQWVWLALKSAEFCGLKLNFRSDSLVSLIYQNPKPDFSANSQMGLICRPFEIEKLKLS
ncbi:MAG: NAD-dependent epimerase/dehydratase family protein [Limisphaerales bacterium]